LGCAFASGIYFDIVSSILNRIFVKFAKWIVISIITVFFIITVFLVPTWNGSAKFYQSINDIQYNTVVLNIYKIKKNRRPFSWTVVGFVQAYSRVLDKGFHINSQTFIEKYNPFSKYLEVPTEYVYIFLENIKSSFRGSGEWYFRWKKDINLQLAYFMGFKEIYLIGMDFSYIIPDSHKRTGDVLLSDPDDENHFHKD
jgi:hypothetical protein